MVNIVGPFGAGINETTVRPADEASGLSLDTWFKDCISGVRQTGTIPTHTWRNKVTALLRRAIRGMGVAEDELDDDMLLKAIQAAQLNFENVSDGTPVHHEFNVLANAHNIRSIKGVNIAVTIDPATGAIILTGEVPEEPLSVIAPVMYLEERRVGSATPQAFPIDLTPVRRRLNTIVQNQIDGALLDDGLVTLPAGTYRFRWAAVGFNCNVHFTQLRNVTAGTDIANGLACDSRSLDPSLANASTGQTRVTLATETVIELRHRVWDDGYKGDALGVNANISPDHYLDAWLAITQETQ